MADKNNSRYYQWVCFTLFFQAIVFYVPRFLVSYSSSDASFPQGISGRCLSLVEWTCWSRTWMFPWSTKIRRRTGKRFWLTTSWRTATTTSSMPTHSLHASSSTLSTSSSSSFSWTSSWAGSSPRMVVTLSRWPTSSRSSALILYPEFSPRWLSLIPHSSCP